MENQYPNQNPGFNPYNFKNQSIVSVGDWIVTFIIMIIPLVNIIMLFVWAFGSGTPESKANWAKANLIMYLVAIILVVIFWGVIFGIIGSMM